MGDLAESRESGGQALRDMLGLVVRRQAALWLGWRPWLVLAALVVPLGMLIGVSARLFAGGSATPIWMYVNNWTWTYVTNPRARLDLVEIGAGILVQYLTLACWSWICGFALGFLARCTIRINGLLFCLMLIVGEFAAMPILLWYLPPRPASPDFNSAVSALIFYRTIFPALVLIVLAILPTLWGVRHGLCVASLRPRLRRILRVVSLTSLVLIVLRSWVGPRPNIFVQLAGLHGQWLRMASLLTYWPIGYLIANAIAHRTAIPPSNAGNAVRP